MLVEKIKSLNTEFKKLCDTNTELIINIHKIIMKSDIETYLNNSNINFEINKHSTYIILDFYPFEEISISDFGFSVRLKNIYINSSFNIELKDYTTFSDVFKVTNEYHSLSADYFIDGKIYNLDAEIINSLINQFEERISNLKSNIDYLESHVDMSNYSYEYSLYNKVYAPEVFFKDMNEIMNYIKKSL